MKPSLSYYQTIRVDGRVVRVKPDAMNHLSQVEAVIFDCDGVLIDTRKSYDTTIVRTAHFILKQLLGFSFPQRVITQSIIHMLRGSGGFNNDWDSTYVILLGVFSCLPKQFLKDYDYVRGGRANLDLKVEIHESAQRIHLELARFVEQADSSGLVSVEKALFTKRLPQWKEKALRAFKKDLGYPKRGADSLLAIVFDEIFYGPELFQQAHNRAPQFHIGAGAIDNEIPIITEPTLKQLTDMVGKRNLGLASGRGTLSTQKTLGRLFDYFNPKARILLEDEELETHNDIEALRIERAKPAPYSLLKSAQAMKKFKRAIYVGDSAEDLIMARRANATDPRYLFVGVTDRVYSPALKQTMFAEAAADLIVPSVNQLPDLLRAAKAGRTS